MAGQSDFVVLLVDLYLAFICFRLIINFCFILFFVFVLFFVLFCFVLFCVLFIAGYFKYFLNDLNRPSVRAAVVWQVIQTLLFWLLVYYLVFICFRLVIYFLFCFVLFFVLFITEYFKYFLNDLNIVCTHLPQRGIEAMK